MRMILSAIALLFATSVAVSTAALADQKPGGNDESPSDDNAGTGNDPPGGAGGAPPGTTQNPNPGKLFDDTAPVWLEGFVLAADNVAPGSGNWGGGPGNSGPGDKNGQNDKSKDGGQTPNDDK